ncbi:MAG: type II secretion system protein [Methylophilales bacterium]|nr:type II secretion system protein [Methylophilales bacterium]
MRTNMQLARGFSLIELVVSTVVIGIMAMALSPLLLSSLKAYDSTLGNEIVLDKLRYATERVAREIRGVQYASSTTTPSTNCNDSPTTTDHYCITTMTPTNLQFRRSYTDTAGNVTWRTVTINGSGSTLTLAYSDINSGAAQVLTDELSSLSFSYLQQDGATTATLAGNTNCLVTETCVGSVVITLTLSHNGNPYTQRTSIGIRTTPI